MNRYVPVFLWAPVWVVLGMYLGMESLGHVVTLCLIIWGTAGLFPWAPVFELVISTLWGLMLLGCHTFHVTKRGSMDVQNWEMITKLKALPAKWFCMGFFWATGGGRLRKGQMEVKSSSCSCSESRWCWRREAPVVRWQSVWGASMVGSAWKSTLTHFTFCLSPSILNILSQTHPFFNACHSGPSCALFLSLARIWLSGKMPAGPLKATANFHC